MNPTQPEPVWKTRPPAAFLPHTPPMVLLDDITMFDGNRIVCQVTYTDEAFFQCPQGVPAAWSVEIIAQACAVFVCLRSLGSNLTSGRLLKCRSFELLQPWLPYQTPLRVTASLVMEGGAGVWIFRGDLENAEGLSFASGELSIQAS